jgi:hypothetical protein
MQSGTKLVLGIFSLALAAGALSWWYRYEAAHRSTNFWGPHFAELIARPSKVTAIVLDEISFANAGDEAFQIGKKFFETKNRKDITKAPGLVHLRNALLSDSNYRWDRNVTTDDWRWCLQFADADRKATILFNENLTMLGCMNQPAEVRTVDCQPMAETLREYFKSSNIFAPLQPETPASKTAE